MNALEREQWEREGQTHDENIADAARKLLQAIDGRQQWMLRGIHAGVYTRRYADVAGALSKPTRRRRR